MPKLSAKPTPSKTGLMMVGYDQSLRINCKDKFFADGPTGDTVLTRDPIEMVMVTYELVHGPVPGIAVDKLRDPSGGPLKYAFAQGQINAKSTDQEFIQAVVKSSFKNRGIIYGFVAPWSHESFSPEGKAAISPAMLTTTNFHNVSLTRSKGGFAKFLIDLQVAGYAPWEVITRIGIDTSHKGPTGDDLAGVFFDYRLPETKEEKDFLKRVKETVEAHGDQDIPRPRTLQACIPYEGVEQFLVDRETMPRFMGTVLAQSMIQGTEYEPNVDIRQLEFAAATEFNFLAPSEIQEMATQLLGPVQVAPVVDLSATQEATIDVVAA